MFRTIFVVSAMALLIASAQGQRRMENLGRGVVAVNQGEGKVFVSWRLLGIEPESTAFNVYRTTGNGQPVKLNSQPLARATCYQDSGVDFSQPVSYTVRAVLDGAEQAAGAPFTLAANAPVRQYISIPLKEGLNPNDASAADLDGDGEYEIILKREERGRDNAQAGITGETHMEAYKLDGTFMWRINLGKNIRSGAHYTQFMVADFDGNGKAEMIVKTADGTVDGMGKVIGDANADWRVPEGTTIVLPGRGGRRGPATNPAPVQANAGAARGGARQGGQRGRGAAADAAPSTQPQGTNIAGHILSGPEYLTVFDGVTGAALATTNYNPPRHSNLTPTPQERIEVWGDATGNRSDRFLACIAWLDGNLPSAVMCRGYYTRTTLAAWDWRDGKLTQRWFFDSAVPGNGKDGKPLSEYAGQGNHGISVADVDADGRDEIVYGAMCVDDDGKGLWTTGLRHGDAMHVSDLDPNRPGIEVFGIHEGGRTAGAALLDGRTGEIIWATANQDTGRGLAADIDPRFPGAEYFGGPGGSKNAKGESINVRGGNNFAIWWDGDLHREILNSNQITKWNWETGQMDRIFVAEECSSNNGTKSTPALSADLFGDWREELMERTTDNAELRIYTTVIPTEHRFYTLMHDPQYRAAIAWQNVAYNQPPWPSFFIGHDMKAPPKQNIRVK